MVMPSRGRPGAVGPLRDRLSSALDSERTSSLCSPTRGAGRVTRAGVSVVEFDQTAALDQVGMSQGLLRGQHDLRGDIPVVAKDLHPLLGGPLLNSQQDAIARPFDGLRCPGRRTALELLFGEQFTEQVGRGEERVEEMLEKISVLDPASVLSSDGVVVQCGHGRSSPQRDELASLLDRELQGQSVEQIERHQALQQTRLDPASLAAELAAKQRRGAALDGRLAGHVRGHLDRGIDRSAP